MAGSCYLMQFCDSFVMFLSDKFDLILHLVIVYLQSPELQFELICEQLGTFIISLELLDFLFALTVDFAKADHLTLVHLQLASGVL